jgi:hypothetical protein
LEHRVYDPFLEVPERAPAVQPVTSNESLAGPGIGGKSSALVFFAEAVWIFKYRPAVNGVPEPGIGVRSRHAHRGSPLEEAAGTALSRGTRFSRILWEKRVFSSQPGGDLT